eukprot:10728449-Alexandrium_andersonii.AAC.1
MSGLSSRDRGIGEATTEPRAASSSQPSSVPPAPEPVASRCAPTSSQSVLTGRRGLPWPTGLQATLRNIS